jgi:tryptophan-rich sensory protein
LGGGAVVGGEVSIPIAGPGLTTYGEENGVQALSLRKSLNVSGIIGIGSKFRIGRDFLVVEARYNRMLLNSVNLDNRYSIRELVYQFGYVDNDFRIDNFSLSVGFEKSFYKPRKKPKYNPPNYVFSIVWPILYIMIGTIYSFALYDSLCIPDKMSKCGSTIYFKGLNYWIIPMLALLFNFMYIPVFFGENGLYNGLIIIILSLVFAILTLIQFYLQDNYNSNIKYYAILALLPYIIWLSFATYLSYDLYMLNR